MSDDPVDVLFAIGLTFVITLLALTLFRLMGGFNGPTPEPLVSREDLQVFRENYRELHDLMKRRGRFVYVVGKDTVYVALYSVSGGTWASAGIP